MLYPSVCVCVCEMVCIVVLQTHELEVLYSCMHVHKC